MYVIVDPSHTNGRSTVDVAKAALSGGAIAIQLRHKGGPSGEIPGRGPDHQGDVC